MKLNDDTSASGPAVDYYSQDTGIPRRVRLSAREIGVALVLTFAALVQIYWATSSTGEKVSSATIPLINPESVNRQAR